MWSHCFVLCLATHCFFPGTRALQIVEADSPDDNAPTPEIARHHGYLCETHRVTTEDKFILQIHRLPGGKSTVLNTSLTPVLLQHGLLDSSAAWVISGPDKALGYLLADQGYDVWMGNARGNIYSKAHETLHPDDPNFWNWTWDEMGRYDLPAVIDYILQVTGHQQILYIGHSMGTTMFFVLCSSRPEYNTKVRYMAALAPVAYMGHTTSPLRYLAPYAQSFERIADFFGNGEFLPRNAFINYIFRYSCEAFRFEERICENYLFLICGHDPEQFDENLLPMILGHVPAGASTKTLVHYAQEIKSNHFPAIRLRGCTVESCRGSHYGSERDIILYNSTTPPLYKLSKVSVPVSLHYGDNDLLARPMVSILVEGRGVFVYTTGLRGILFCTIAQTPPLTTPPLYNLSKVSVPVSLLHYGDNDLLARPMVSVPVSLHYGDNEPVGETHAPCLVSLKNPVGMFRVNLSSFNHLDFLWGRDARTLVYSKIQSLMGEYSTFCSSPDNLA
ncbi:lipase 3-like [Homalodisca vitripennis]|uniref:lipase 3-like n=1 Tax=Homalodisca vitripennis TaxID=197043 RepID=UPI001EECBB1F|nr:lipase 3-like [Homalodisca vitripennis]